MSFYIQKIGVFDTDSYQCSQMLHYLVNGGHAGKYWLREGHSQICKNSSHYLRDW